MRRTLATLALAVLLIACGSGAGPASPTPTPTIPADAVKLTNDDHGKTVPVAVDQLVVVSLGDNLDWTLNISDTTVLSPEPGMNALARGTQLIARARKPGTVVIDGQGKPRCASGQPCILLIGVFHVTIVVR